MRNQTQITRNSEDEFEDTKGTIRIRISKNSQHNGQKKKYKHWYTKDTYKTKLRVTRTPLKPGVNSSAPLVAPVVLI